VQRFKDKEQRTMTRHLAITLILLVPTLLATGCGGGGDESGGDNTGQDTKVAPEGGDPLASDPTGGEPVPSHSPSAEAGGDLSGAPNDLASPDGPELEFAIPGEDFPSAENGGSDAESKKSVSQAIFNSIFRGVRGGTSDGTD
jgi:hypothetical protein